MASEIAEVLVLDSPHLSASSSSAPTHDGEFYQLVVDDEDEAIDLRIPMSETASISSSLFEHVEENGRTYHKYKEGKYMLPNDEIEQNRLDLQHHLSKLALHGRLHLAPLKTESLKTALDIATGTGIWAIEFAQNNPQTQVIGSDLSPIQPELIPENLSFEVDDAEDAWIYPHPFSYIHGRFTIVCWTDPLRLFKKAFDALSPGGYFEMQDPSSPLRSVDNSLEGTAILKSALLVTEAFAKRGIDLTTPVRYKAMMEQVGFVDVMETVIDWPIGTWAKDRYYKMIGAWFQKDLLQGIEGMLLGLCTRVLGMEKEETMKLVEDVKRDMVDKRIHSYQAFYVVYGRKPE